MAILQKLNPTNKSRVNSKGVPSVYYSKLLVLRFIYILMYPFAKNKVNLAFSLISLYRPKETRLLYAQAQFETGDFKSAICKENKNLFGMKRASVRFRYQNNELNRNHITYPTYFDSIFDMILWLEYANIKDFSDPIAFVEILKSKNYFEGNLLAYGKGVLMYFNQYPSLRINTYFMRVFTVALIFGFTLTLLFQKIKKSLLKKY